MKRMTDFISGVVYALGGSMKKIGHNILVCAPKNVDINADDNIYDERGDSLGKITDKTGRIAFIGGGMMRSHFKRYAA